MNRGLRPTAIAIPSTSSEYVTMSGPAASTVMSSLCCAAQVAISATSSIATGCTRYVPRRGNGEDRHPPQQPRDVVEQDVTRSEYEGWPDDRPAQPRRPDDLFGPRLAGVIVQVGVDRGVADRDVHDLSDAGFRRSAGQDPGVGDGVAEAQLAVAEPHPVRVIESVRAAQALDERCAIRELQRRHVHLDLLATRTLRVVGQGTNAALLRQQALGDGAAREAERPGDDVEPRLHQRLNGFGRRFHQNGNRVRSYASEPGFTCPEITTRGRCRIASAGSTSGRSPLKIGNRSVPSGDHSE